MPTESLSKAIWLESMSTSDDAAATSGETAASNVPFKPKHHFGVESLHRAWINTEGLPEYRTDEYQALVDRWVEATGAMPE